MPGRHFLQRLLAEPILIKNRGATYPALGASEVSRKILRELGCLPDASEEDFAAGTPSTTDDVVP